MSSWQLPTWKRFALLGGLYALVHLALPAPLQLAGFVVLSAAAALAVVHGVRVHAPVAPLPWVLIGGALASTTVGNVLYALRGTGAGDPPPVLGFLTYLLAYALLLATTAVLLRRRGGLGNTAAWLDASIWTIGVMVVFYEVVLEPRLPTASGPVELLMVVGYPVMDIALLLVFARMVVGRGAQATALRWLAAALVVQMVTDLVYGGQQATGSYAVGGLLDLGWLLSAVGLGVAALHPSMATMDRPPTLRSMSSRVRLVSLLAPALLLPGMLAWQVLQGDHVDGLLLAAAAALLFLLIVLRCLTLLHDVEQTSTALRDQAGRDGLTGLPNRALFMDVLTASLAEGGPGTSVVLLDLDDFKEVNDSLGHGAGDLLLQEVSARLQRTLRAGDLVARLGGDEFAAVLSGEPAACAAGAARLVAALEEPVLVLGHELPLRASAGVVHAGDHGRTAPDLLRAADLAMYDAKRHGGRALAPYTIEMGEALARRLDVRANLEVGLARGEVEAHLQPIVDLATGELAGFEALARWRRPDRGLVPPCDFVEDAEVTGLIVELDLEVLRQAARTLADWTARVAAAQRLTLAVNASGRTVQHPGIAEKVLAVLAEAGLAPHRLVLEVTEGVLVESDSAGRALQRLRASGVRIALDDFGTGWSSLSYLQRFPVDELKLDRSFTEGLTAAPSRDGDAVPTAVLTLARSLGLDVVAEGVETPAQCVALERLGCRLVQGYLFGRPQPAPFYEQLVAAGRLADDAASLSGRDSTSRALTQAAH